MRIHTFALAAAATLATALPASADVYGHWLSEKSDAGTQIIVEITPCGDSACGKIAWLSAPNDDAGQPKTDLRNKDAAMHSRPLCGAPMLGDFTKNGDKWEKGFIYAPDTGKTYNSNMHLTEDGNLYVRGYVGFALIGRSQTWTREDGNRGGC